MSTAVSERLRREIADRAYRVCEYCLIHERDTFWGCEVDHIISRKHGGPSTSENLAWACAVCNGYKGSDLGTMVGQPPRLTPLFNPRSDRWRECFQLVRVRIEGLTPGGLATVSLLQLNHESRVREREILARLGRFPSIEALARMKE